MSDRSRFINGTESVKAPKQKNGRDRQIAEERKERVRKKNENDNGIDGEIRGRRD